MHTHDIFALGLVCAVLSGCGGADLDRGAMRTEVRAVGTFDSIDMDGDGKLQIQVGAPASVTVEGREAVVANIKTEVRGTTLHIDGKRRDWMFFGGSPRLTLRITVPRLASLKLDGGNDVRLTGFNGGKSNIHVQGAAHLQADGVLKGLTVYLAGAGHADFSRLVADEAKVTVDGIGSVYVNSKDSLDATMNGVGAILYTGNPHVVNTTMNGLGRISQRKPEELEERGRREPIDPESLQPEYEKDAGEERSKVLEKLPPGEVI